jgi:hypothetical protein
MKEERKYRLFEVEQGSKQISKIGECAIVIGEFMLHFNSLKSWAGI